MSKRIFDSFNKRLRSQHRGGPKSILEVASGFHDEHIIEAGNIREKIDEQDIRPNMIDLIGESVLWEIRICQLENNDCHDMFLSD